MPSIRSPAISTILERLVELRNVNALAMDEVEAIGQWLNADAELDERRARKVAQLILKRTETDRRFTEVEILSIAGFVNSCKKS